MTTLILHPWAPRPDLPSSPETVEAWRTKLREAGCIWIVTLHPDGDTVELACPEAWLTELRRAWLDAHAGELRALALMWGRWEGDKEAPCSE